MTKLIFKLILCLIACYALGLANQLQESGYEKAQALIAVEQMNDTTEAHIATEVANSGNGSSIGFIILLLQALCVFWFATCVVEFFNNKNKPKTNESEGK